MKNKVSDAAKLYALIGLVSLVAIFWYASQPITCEAQATLYLARYNLTAETPPPTDTAIKAFCDLQQAKRQVLNDDANAVAHYFTALRQYHKLYQHQGTLPDDAQLEEFLTLISTTPTRFWVYPQEDGTQWSFMVDGTDQYGETHAGGAAFCFPGIEPANIKEALRLCIIDRLGQTRRDSQERTWLRSFTGEGLLYTDWDAGDGSAWTE